MYDIAGSACILRHPWPPRFIILLQAFGGRLWHIVYVVVIALRCQPEGLRITSSPSYLRPRAPFIVSGVRLRCASRSVHCRCAQSAISWGRASRSVPREEAVHKTSISLRIASQFLKRDTIQGKAFHQIRTNKCAVLLKSRKLWPVTPVTMSILW